jgi:hypothetical protein
MTTAPPETPFNPWNGATFSADHRHRYVLWRIWAAGPLLAVIGLNPSTADEERNDPTVRRAIGYARRWGCAGLVMLNLYGFRATDPQAMRQAPDPMGPQNWDAVLSQTQGVLADGGALLVAWGSHGTHGGAGARMRGQLEAAGIACACLGYTQGGQPRHPLYLAGASVPEAYLGDGGRLVTQWDAETGRVVWPTPGEPRG